MAASLTAVRDACRTVPSRLAGDFARDKFREIIRLFSLDIEAVKIAKITSLNRNTINRILLGVRGILAEYCEEQSSYSGVVEVDESYFGARRVKGKRGRGALFALRHASMLRVYFKSNP